jgi:DNA-binding Xre family transcriptional regulator
MPHYRLRIAQLLKEKGLDNTYKIVKQMGKPPAQASRLLDSKRTQINEDLVNEMCEFLNCTPGDLWEIVDEKPKKKSGKK